MCLGGGSRSKPALQQRSAPEVTAAPKDESTNKPGPGKAKARTTADSTVKELIGYGGLEDDEFNPATDPYQDDIGADSGINY